MKAPDSAELDKETTQRDGKTSGFRAEHPRAALWFYHLQLAGYQSSLTSQKSHL